MYKLRSFYPIISTTSQECFNGNQIKILRHFNNRFKQRETRPRDEDYQNSAVCSAFRTREVKTVEDWAMIRKELTETIRQITATNFDSIALGCCLKTRDYKLAELCIKFIQEENYLLSLAVIGKMFQIYRNMYEENVFIGNYDNIIIKMYEDIRSRYKVLDSLTLESAVVALSSTKHWNICLDLLKEIEISSVPNTMSYNCTAIGAFKNQEYNTGWKLMYEMMSNNRPPSDICYKAILLDCMEKNAKTNFHNLLHFFNKYDIICSMEILKLIEEASAKFKYKPKETSLSEIGKCSNCDKYLPRVILSQEEFDDLKNAFFSEVIIGRNVFCKSNPEEVERFQNFLETARKYDVVVDGLNVAYATGSSNHIVMANTLSCVVDYFTARDKQVLVLGRIHMMKWPRKYMSQIKRNADVFLTHDLSYDDPYLIYCALHSGQNTMVISRDYMRSHSVLLKSDLHRKLFKRWLVQSRYEFISVQRNGRVVFAKPLPYLQICQETQFGWHVPYLLNGQVIPENGRIHNWFCIEKYCYMK